MASSKRSMNWTTVTFNGATITGVTSLSFDNGGSVAKFSGDGDKYPTTVINDMNNPSATLASADVAAIYAMPPGTRSSLVATLNDAKGGVTSGNGARTFTLANAVVENNPISGAHRQFASGTVTFQAESSDGSTNPLSSSAV